MKNEIQEGQEDNAMPEKPESGFSGRRLVEFINGNPGLVKRVMVKPHYSYIETQEPRFKPTYKSGEYAIKHQINYELFNADGVCFRTETEAYLNVPTSGYIKSDEAQRAILTAYQRSKDLKGYVRGTQVQHVLSLDRELPQFSYSGRPNIVCDTYTSEEMEGALAKGIKPFVTEPLV